MTGHREPPPIDRLTRAQTSGWACCWCGRSLMDVEAVPAGVARGQLGVHVLDSHVWACPDCAAMPRPIQTPVRPAPRDSSGRAGSIASTRRRKSTGGGTT